MGMDRAWLQDRRKGCRIAGGIRSGGRFILVHREVGVPYVEGSKVDPLHPRPGVMELILRVWGAW